MGREIQIAPDTYTLTAYRVEDTERQVTAEFNSAATPAEARAWVFGNRASGLCTLLTFVAIVTACHSTQGSGDPTPFAYALLLATTAWCGCYLYRRLSAYDAARRIYRNVERHWPSVVLVLRASRG